MRSGLILAALGLLCQGAAQAQFIPANPVSPYIFVDPNQDPNQTFIPWGNFQIYEPLTNGQTFIPWNGNQTVVPWVTWNRGDGVVQWANPYWRSIPQNGVPRITVVPANLMETRVTLDLDNVPLKEAMQKLFDQAPKGSVLELDKDAPKDIRITLRVKNIKFVTALTALAEQANLNWGLGMHPDGSKNQPKTVISLFRAPKDPQTPPSPIYYDGFGLYSPYSNGSVPRNQWRNYNYYTLPYSADPSNSYNLYWNKEGSKPQNYHFTPWYRNSNDPPKENFNFYSLPPGSKPQPMLWNWNGLSNAPILVKPEGSDFLTFSAMDDYSVPFYEVSPTQSFLYNRLSILQDKDANITAKPIKNDFDVKPNSSQSVPLNLQLNYSVPNTALNVPLDGSNTVVYTVTGQEDHATFTCPHCKKQITIVRRKQTQNSPASRNDWRFCPNCGKPVR